MKEECWVRRSAVDLLTDREGLIARFCDPAIIVPLEPHHLWVQLDDEGPWSFVEYRGSRARWTGLSGPLCGNAGSAVILLTVEEDAALDKVSELLRDVVCGFPEDCEWAFGVSVGSGELPELQMDLLVSGSSRTRRQREERYRQVKEWDRLWDTYLK